MAGEVAMSQRVFKKRETCRFPDKEKNKSGLYLVTIKEPTPSIRIGHKYFNATMDRSAVSSKGTLAAFLEAPKKVCQRNKYGFFEPAKDNDVADFDAYLLATKQATASINGHMTETR